MKRDIKDYGFSEVVLKTIEPIINLILEDNIKKAEKEIAKLALEACDNIEKRDISPKQADDYFTLLDLYITDNFHGLRLRKEVQDLITEGMIIHDYGKEYGADLDAMRELAKKIEKE